MPLNHVHTRHERVIFRIDVATPEARDAAEKVLLTAVPGAVVEGRADRNESFTSLVSIRLLVRYSTADVPIDLDDEE